MNKNIRTAILLIVVILVLVSLSFITKKDKDTIYINTDDESPIELIGGGGERIYLRFGTIYAFKDDPEKEYRVVAITFHVTQKQWDRMIFFNTPEEAGAAGYKPSKDFQEDYNCVKQGKDLFECPERNSE
ncbi:MAG: hypothetical protein HY481_01800 [Candidatus Vogelbacteria bacterium]|nr:hypothetical protein [Candidatus Vogelbacteria bacterium]